MYYKNMYYLFYKMGLQYEYKVKKLPVVIHKMHSRAYGKN